MGGAKVERNVVVVGLVTDPDLPTEIADKLAEGLPRILARSVSDKVRWDVRVLSKALPLDEDGNVEVWKHSNEVKSDEGWDYMVCITELTRRLDDQPVLSSVSETYGAALISLPALGPFRLSHHVQAAIVRVVRDMANGDVQPGHDQADPDRAHRSPIDRFSPIYQKTINDGAGTDSYLALAGVRGRIRLLLGMVRINRPWRLVISLDRAIAAAVASAAFGIFYSSVWNMADQLSPIRLASISLIAIAAMVTWLIIHNGLWERPRDLGGRKETAVYNTATLLTVAIGVACMYLVLFAVTMLGALAVIPGQYLQSTLGHPVTWMNYAVLAWLASSLGTFAGALGSSFENDNAVREATYGKREQERHALSKE